MVQLKNNYYIKSDGKTFAVAVKTNRQDKTGADVFDIISYHTTFDGALQAYCNSRMADAVADFEMDLEEIKSLYKELKEEVKGYSFEV